MRGIFVRARLLALRDQEAPVTRFEAFARWLPLDGSIDGLARRAGLTALDFDPAALEQGTAIEQEHTSNRLQAQQIAMDHLTEDPSYYRKLRKADL